MRGELVRLCELAQLYGFADPCEGRYDRCHVGFRKQTLRRAGLTEEQVFDPRCWMYGCRKHHEMSHWARTPPLDRRDLPESVEEFAQEHGLEYRLDADYGELEEAA